MADVLCPVVVGRDRELDALRSALDAARSGQGTTTSAIRDALATGLQPDGSIRLDNVFKVVVARTA